MECIKSFYRKKHREIFLVFFCANRKLNFFSHHPHITLRARHRVSNFDGVCVCGDREHSMEFSLVLWFSHAMAEKTDILGAPLSHLANSRTARARQLFEHIIKWTIPYATARNKCLVDCFFFLVKPVNSVVASCYSFYNFMRTYVKCPLWQNEKNTFEIMVKLIQLLKLPHDDDDDSW